MKIIMSQAVLAESNRVGNDIARLISPLHIDKSLSEVLAESHRTYNSLANYSQSIDLETGEVTLEINDKVILAFFKLYGKGAHVIKTVLDVVKALMPALKADVDEITALVIESR